MHRITLSLREATPGQAQHVASAQKPRTPLHAGWRTTSSSQRVNTEMIANCSHLAHGTNSCWPALAAPALAPTVPAAVLFDGRGMNEPNVRVCWHKVPTLDRNMLCSGFLAGCVVGSMYVSYTLNNQATASVTVKPLAPARAVVEVH